MKIHIHHRTSYFYSEQVPFGVHQLMMRPRETQAMHLEECSLEISLSHHLRWIRDHYENNIGLVDFKEAARELLIDCKFVLGICEDNPFDFVLAPEVATYPFHYEHELHSEILPLIRNIYIRDVELIRIWLEGIWSPGKTVETLQFLQELNLKIYSTFQYQRRERRGVQTPAETLETMSGSCRDLATFFIEACRTLGIAARFVSGYLYSPGITGRMSMHGWTEVYLPGAGWIGFDPSWGVLADFHYIPVAVSRHSEHAAPISGTYLGTPKVFLKSEVELYVTRSSTLSCIPTQEETVA